MGRRVGAETLVHSDLDTLWDVAIEPEQHARWDLRFSSITLLDEPGKNSASRFRYATRIGFGLEISGWGESAGERAGRSSGLRFGSDHPLSLISSGSGGWIWRQEGDYVRFWTVFDYKVRWGKLGQMLDLIFRPLMAWGTQWSFDRLRLWIEKGQDPKVSFAKWSLQQGVRLALVLFIGLLSLGEKTEMFSNIYQPSASLFHLEAHFIHAAMLALAAIALLLASDRRTGWFITAGVTLFWSLDAVSWGLHSGVGLSLTFISTLLATATSSIPSARRGRPTEHRRWIPGGGDIPTLGDANDEHHPTPFEQILRPNIDALHPMIAQHFLTPGSHNWRGQMDIVERPRGLVRWLTGPFLHIGAMMQAIFPDTGEGIPFELDHESYLDRNGKHRMRWLRRFYFPAHRQPGPPRIRRFDAHMFVEQGADHVLDDLGSTGILRVRLTPTVRPDGGVVLQSSHPALVFFGGRLRIPIPSIFTPQARIEEWPLDPEDLNSKLGIDVDVHLWLIGSILHYRGWHGPAED